jgi:hypothetical protein
LSDVDDVFDCGFLICHDKRTWQSPIRNQERRDVRHTIQRRLTGNEVVFRLKVSVMGHAEAKH